MLNTRDKFSNYNKMKNEADNLQEQKGNGVLPCVSGSLPTDEDISKKAQEARVEDINDSINRVGGFIVGATWMRDLLKGNDR